MADWGLPTITSQYENVLDELKDRTVSLAKMFDGVSDTNIPNAAIRWSSSNTQFEKWNGSAWLALDPSLKTHLAINSLAPGNPHGTTAAHVGAPTLTAFNTHVADTANPHGTTAAQVGSPTTAAFNAHVSNVSNPHATTAAQVGAPAIASNLSEYSAQAATARTNIGAAAAADLSAHTGNLSNPHATTPGQIGAAAISGGVNTDITALSGASSVGWQSGSTTLHASSGGALLMALGGTTNYRANTTAFGPGSSGQSRDLGTASIPWENVRLKGKIRHTTATGSWSFFGGQPVAISSLDSELAVEGGFTSTYPNAYALLHATARSVNQIAQWLVNHGIAN